jgi:hypothetical protein
MSDLLTPEQKENHLKMLEVYKKFLEVEIGIETGFKWTFEEFCQKVEKLEEDFMEFKRRKDS